MIIIKTMASKYRAVRARALFTNATQTLPRVNKKASQGGVFELKLKKKESKMSINN
jgi:hypothetical protein